MAGCVIQSGLPECSVPYVGQTFDEEGDVELVANLVGADCWGIRTRYKGKPQAIVECNAYPREGNYIMNTAHPEYISTVNKVESSRFRDRLLLNPADYLASADVVEIFMFGRDSWKVVFTREQSGVFRRKAFQC